MAAPSANSTIAEGVQPRIFLAWAQAQEALRRVTHTICTSFVWLHDESAARGVRNWHVTIKLHLMHHMAEDGVRINPRFGWTYADERYVGVQSEAAQSTAKPGALCKFDFHAETRSAWNKFLRGNRIH